MLKKIISKLPSLRTIVRRNPWIYKGILTLIIKVSSLYRRLGEFTMREEAKLHKHTLYVKRKLPSTQFYRVRTPRDERMQILLDLYGWDLTETSITHWNIEFIPDIDKNKDNNSIKDDIFAEGYIAFACAEDLILWKLTNNPLD